MSGRKAQIGDRWGVLLVLVLSCSDGGANRVPDASTPLDASTPRDAQAGEDGGEDAGQGVVAPGTVTASGTCEVGVIGGTTCTHLLVHCPEVDDLGVGVRVTFPPAPSVGTVILGSGGTGAAYFEDSGERYLALTNDLLAAGYLVVRRAWDEPGWFAGSAGVHASSCRYATLLGWMDGRTRQAAQPLCAAGLSGGAIELGYALARWDAAARLDAAILVAGPSMSRLDLVCPSVAPEDWLDTGCPALARDVGLSCSGTLLCTLAGAADVVDSAWSPGHPCTAIADADAALLVSDGVVAPGALLDYPTTRTRFVIGAEECSATDLLYYDAITSERQLDLVPGTDHGLFDTDAGQQAVLTAVRETCVR